jgi:creatinine amidohydrolase
MRSARRFEEMLPDEMEAEVAGHPICYIPSGTLEWHSHHLPLGLDGLKVQTIFSAGQPTWTRSMRT